MALTDNLRQHYANREELNNLKRENERRKALIILAIHRVVVSQTRRVQVSKSDETTQLKTRVNDYELYTNKLKQEHSTKVKLQEARLEALKEENASLKTQVRKFKDSVPLAHKSRLSLGMASPLTLPKFSFKAELNQSLPKPIQHIDSIFSPINTKQSKKTYIASKNINQFDLLMNPTKAKKESSVDSGTAELESKNLETEKEKETSTPIEPKTIEGLSDPIKPQSKKSAPEESSPTKHSFMENFDKSSESSSPSPEFTPSRAPPQDLTPIKSESKATFESKLASFSVTDEETFASANSTLMSLRADDGTAKKKKRKLKLWKSNISKIDLGPEKRPKSFGFEDENVNSLNYYQDDNFAHGDGDSPPKSSRKRKIDDVTPPIENVKRKKRNIFTID